MAVIAATCCHGIKLTVTVTVMLPKAAVTRIEVKMHVSHNTDHLEPSRESITVPQAVADQCNGTTYTAHDSQPETYWNWCSRYLKKSWWWRWCSRRSWPGPAGRMWSSLWRMCSCSLLSVSHVFHSWVSQRSTAHNRGSQSQYRAVSSQSQQTAVSHNRGQSVTTEGSQSQDTMLVDLSCYQAKD